ncbi:alkaline phosphatase family protein [Zavarzinella formosa]|uniref:alkaline phosphatase family protein n=1 Tax=Zavarzinella formosa TaxID=360055 RepID=UPI00049536FC|nr:alkaline phosphatase family protein [Zavarzinella formosa]
MFRLLALIGLLTAAPLFAVEPEKPKLVVLVVFDQMRGDYIDKWQPLFGQDGFVRMEKDGAWYKNCHYPYAITVTGAGHSSMLTGCAPDAHGIIGNTWYERKSAATVNCSESSRYERVPPAPKVVPEPVKPEDTEKKETEETEKKEVKAMGTPERLLAPTFGNAIKEATGGKARVIGLSFKDRSAILPVGSKADGAYWLDSADGMIVTSSFFRDSVHPWVAEFNKSRIADRWFGKDWSKYRPDLDYAKYSGVDEGVGEGTGIKQGRLFPHPTDGGGKKIGKAYYEALYNSPYGNELLLELVKTAVVAEKLGQHEVPDLLSVSFSSNDSVGHSWGPDSQEVLDTTLRSDKIMADLLKFLDETVGKDKYLLCLTADHGVCPLPELSAKNGLDAKRFPSKKIMAAAELYLRLTYMPDAVSDKKTRFIENVTSPWVYLNEKLLAANGLKTADVAKTLASFLAKQEGIARTFTREELEGSFPADDRIGQRMKKSYYASRSGDLGILLKPYWLEGDRLTGTNHGSPYPYDTHVPLLVFGANVKPGIRKEEVTPQTIASIFAKALGIAPPAKAEFPAPKGLFEKE